MKKKNLNMLFPLILIGGDAIFIFLSFLLSYWIRFYSPLTSVFPVTKGIPPVSLYLYSSILVIGVWLLVFNAYGLYKSSRPKAAVDEFFLLVKVISIGTLIFLAFTFFYRGSSYSRLMLAITWTTSIFLLYLGRRIIFKLEKNLIKGGYGGKNAVIVGKGEMGKALYQKLKSQPELGYRLIGMIGPDDSEIETAEIHENKQEDPLVLGKVKDLNRIIKQKEVDLVVLALPLSYHDKILDIILNCEDINVEFQIVPDLLEIMAARANILSVDGTPFISLGRTPLEGWNRTLKKGMDLVFSSLGLVILSPFMFIIGLAIRLDSPGPVFFKQERLGRDGRRFRMCKFRSMYVDAEEKSGPVWTKENDQRRTKVGRFLRKTNLDELPQLINVLKGEMSLVGPRPEREFFVDKFKETIPRYFLRHKVKSGMTGWSQVNGLRGNTSIEERTKYDLFYVENWSLFFDLKILFLTVKNLFLSKNAY